MALKERIYSVLTVSSTEKFTSSLSSVLRENRFFPVKTVLSVSQAKRAMLERDYDIVIVNSPLPDDFGIKLAIDVCNEKNSVALVFVKVDVYPQTYSKVSEFGVLTLPKPTSPQMVAQALDFVCATRERLRRYEKTVSSVKDKMEEIRTVNRAKWLLIDVLKMSEEDAHRYIEKQAMDRCLTKSEIARNIINTYK